MGTPEIKKLAELINDKTVCNGFLTKHNQERYDERFKNVLQCDIEQKNHEHNLSVGKCLASFIEKKQCL
jgi:hypothetical protein